MEPLVIDRQFTICVMCICLDLYNLTENYRKCKIHKVALLGFKIKIYYLLDSEKPRCWHKLCMASDFHRFEFE